MKKTSKKMLAILMAAAMVITLLPSFAITSTADVNNPLKAASYLTDEGSFNALISDGFITKTGNVSWSSSENAAYFNGGYLSLNCNPLKTVTNASGFTISFDAKVTNMNAQTGSIFQLYDSTNARKYFAVNGGSDSHWRRMAIYNNDGSHDDNGSGMSGYWTADFDNTGYCEEGGNDFSNESKIPDSNRWYNVTISMDSTGYLYYYVDGEQRAKFKTTYGGTDGATITPDKVKAAFASFDKLTFGHSVIPSRDNNYWLGNFNGYIRDIRFYATADTNVVGVTNAIAKYEMKMDKAASEKYYTNMQNAYNKYVNACKGLDAYLYGDDTGVSLSTLASELNSATGSMSEWTKPTANVVTQYGANSGNTNYAERYSVNLLASNQVGDTAHSGRSEAGESIAFTGTSNSTEVNVMYGQNVLLFDDPNTIPQFPVVFRDRIGNYNLGKNSKRYTHTVYPASNTNNTNNNDSSEFKLENDKESGHYRDWHGYDNDTNRLDYSYMYDQSSKVSGQADRFACDSAGHWSNANNTGCKNTYPTNWNAYANAIKYIGGDPGVAMKDVQITWAYRVSSSEKPGADSNTQFGAGSATQHTYIYNYYGIKNKLNGKSGVFSSVSNYKDGQLSTMFGNFDIITRDWLTIKNNSDNVANISATNTAYSNIGSAPSADDSTRTTNYGKLRAELAAYAATFNSNAAALGVTTSSFTNFQTDFRAVRTMFTNVDNNGYASPSADLGTLYTNLKAKFEALDPLYDMTSYEADYEAAKAFVDTLGTGSQAYTTTSLNALKSLLDNAVYRKAAYGGTKDRADIGTNADKTAVDGEIASINAQKDVLDALYNFTDYDSVYSAATAVTATLGQDSQAYTTSTINALQTAVSNAAYQPNDGTPDRYDVGVNKDGSSIATEKGAIESAYGALEAIASFDALDAAKQAWLDYIDANAASYTTTSKAAFAAYLNNATEFPIAHSNITARRNMGAVSDQATINAEKDKYIGINPASYLEALADFSQLDAAYAAAIAETTTTLISQYTTTSLTNARTYLNNASEFPIEKNSVTRADTGVSAQGTVNTERDKYINWKTNFTGLDRLADLTYFDAEFDKANTFLMNLDDKTAEYTAASMQTLLNVMKNEDVVAYAASDSTDRADYGQAVQEDADDYADDIKAAMAGLQNVETVATTATQADISAFEAAVAKLNNIDPDAYEVSGDHDLDYARNAANAVISSETTQKEYNGATINVLNGTITQQNINDATSAILNALTVNTKTYAVTKDAQGSTDFDISAKNGSYSDGSATYGTTLIADSGNDETAWYLEIRTGSMHKELAFQGYGRRFQTKVLGTTKIKAVKKTESQNKVKIVRKYGDNPITDKSPVQLVDYVASGSSFTLPAAPAIAFYQFDKYYIGETEYAAGASVTIGEDTEIIARYTVKADADCAINVLSDNAQNQTVAYNTKVTLTGANDTYGWVEAIDATHFRPFKIGKNVEFYASESTELKAVTKSEFDGYKFTFPCVNLRKGGIIESDGKKVFNAQLVNDGKEIQEYGILIAAPLTKADSTPIAMENLLPSMVIIENSGKHEGENAYQILRAKSTKLVGANQFTISVSSLPSQYIYRGYAIYKDANGNLQTVYSEAM